MFNAMLQCGSMLVFGFIKEVDGGDSEVHSSHKACTASGEKDNRQRII